MGLNFDYFKSTPGLLQLIEFIIGVVIVGIVAHYYGGFRSGDPDLFLYLMATAFMIGTFCIVLAGLTSNFELIYHCVAAILLLAASIWMIIVVSDWFGSKTRDAYLAASILGLINGVLYCVSAYNSG